MNDRFVSWVAAVNRATEAQIINIDGKTARRSHDRSNDKPAIHMVSAWANQAGLTLAQTKVDEKSNEITAIPEQLKMLELSGCVVAIDAIGTQPAITRQIVDADAEYVLGDRSDRVARPGSRLSSRARGSSLARRPLVLPRI